MKKTSVLLFLLFALCIGARAQTVTFSVTTPPCNHDGVLAATFTGLTPPLTVTYNFWGSGIAPIVHSGVIGLTDALTSYSGVALYVIATDGSGATAGKNFPGMPPFTYFSRVIPAICPAFGSVSTTVTGGTAPYTYQWFDVVTHIIVGTTNPLSLPDGQYGVTITDAAGCVFGDMDNDTSVSLSSSASFSVTATTTTASCTNGTATAVISSGAVLPVAYSWSTGATTPSITGLSMDNYLLTVTDAIGCKGSAYASVSQSKAITAYITTTPATCLASDGAAIAFGSGGVAPYSYLWSNGATTQAQSGLPAGRNNVRVTDANGCIGSGYSYVAPSTPITVTYSTTPTLCLSPTGSATLSISGGTAPYSTVWYTTPVQTGATATALAQGNYAFRITDALGCVQSGTVTVPPVDVIYASFISTPSICTLSTGSMSATPSGGVTPYTYSWSTGGTASSITGIPSDWYHLTITDGMGCKATYSEFLPYSSTLSTGLTGTNATCLFISDGSLTAVPAGGTTPYHYSWSGGGTTSTVTGLPGNTYYGLTVTDALGCTASAETTLGVDTLSSCYCTIAGTVYNDINGNCTQDPGEGGIQNIKINISGRGYTFTDATGYYSYKVPAGSYTVTENVLAYYPLAPCQAYSVGVTSAPGYGCVLPVNFANTIDTIHDMHICTWDISVPVPGHSYAQVTVITNNGTIPEENVYSGYAPDGQLLAPVSVVPGSFFSGAPYWYTTSSASPLSIAPGGSQAFYMNYNVPTNIPLGTSIVFKDSVTADSPMVNWLSDYSPWNNVRYFTTNVVASFDPNFKEVYPKGTGAAGIITYDDSILEYMVHFQNTGTYKAENIRVVDTLDDNLDWTTLVPIFNSAAQGQVSVDMSGAKKVATFMFNNINLPPVSSEPATSNGMFTYSIKTKKGLPIGTQIKNTASIYFDYNAPVKTNQTLNTIVSVPDKVNPAASVSGSSFSIFPNPANNVCSAIINAEAKGPASINVTDVSGRTVITQAVTVQKGNQTISINTHQLTSGVYFVTFAQDSKSQTQKLVIIKQ